MHTAHEVLIQPDDPALSERIADALAALGYEEPTPVQRETVPILLTGADLLAQAVARSSFAENGFVR